MCATVTDYQCCIYIFYNADSTQRLLGIEKGISMMSIVTVIDVKVAMLNAGLFTQKIVHLILKLFINNYDPNV